MEIPNKVVRYMDGKIFIRKNERHHVAKDGEQVEITIDNTVVKAIVDGKEVEVPSLYNGKLVNASANPGFGRLFGEAE